MTKKRAKVKVEDDLTEEQVKQVMAEYAQAQIAIARHEAELEKIIADLRETTAEKIKVFQETVRVNLSKMQAFAERHKAELFDKKRSMELAHGVLGFRKGTPKLKAAKGYTWKSVFELLKVKYPDSEFIKVEKKLSRSALLDKREDDEVKALMNEIGVEVVQEDSFFVDLKEEVLDKK